MGRLKVPSWDCSDPLGFGHGSFDIEHQHYSKCNELRFNFEPNVWELRRDGSLNFSDNVYNSSPPPIIKHTFI